MRPMAVPSAGIGVRGGRASRARRHLPGRVGAPAPAVRSGFPPCRVVVRARYSSMASPPRHRADGILPVPYANTDDRGSAAIFGHPAASTVSTGRVNPAAFRVGRHGHRHTVRGRQPTTNRRSALAGARAPACAAARSRPPVPGQAAGRRLAPAMSAPMLQNTSSVSGRVRTRRTIRHRARERPARHSPATRPPIRRLRRRRPRPHRIDTQEAVADRTSLPPLAAGCARASRANTGADGVRPPFERLESISNLLLNERVVVAGG